MVRELADGRGLVKLSVTQTRILNGSDDLSTWTDAELEYGARRGKDGRFRKKPKVIAREVHDELVRRRLSKSFVLLKESVYSGVSLLRQVIDDEEASYSDRIRATEMVMDRVLGKPQQNIALEALIDIPAWQKLANAAIVSVADLQQAARDGIVATFPEAADAAIVEGEIVEPEPTKLPSRAKRSTSKKTTARRMPTRRSG